MILFDEEGSEISGELYQALLSLLILRSGKSPTLVQPVSASWIHDELARKNKGKILRSKTFPRHFQEKVKEMNGGGPTGKLYYPPQFLQIMLLLTA